MPPTPPPEELRLVTGDLDDARVGGSHGPVVLTPEHSRFDLFAWAWRWQSSWTPQQHTEFWEMALRYWPTSRGQRGNRDALAFSLLISREAGIDDDTFIAELPGVSRDDWTRRGIFARADLMADQLAGKLEHEPPRLPWLLASSDPGNAIDYALIGPSLVGAAAAAHSVGELSAQAIANALSAIARFRSQ